MSKLDINRLLKLAGVQLKESADYDFGHVEPRARKVTTLASKPGQANLPVRMINNQGDNPLVDEDDVDGDDAVDSAPQDAQMSDLRQGQICTININGEPRAVTVQFAGKMFVTFQDNETGETDTIPRTEFESGNHGGGADSAFAQVDGDGDETMQEAPFAAVDGDDDRNDLDHMYDEIGGEDSMSRNVHESVDDIVHMHIDDATIEKLHSLLAKAGVHDSAITSHDVQLTPAGYTKLAHKLTDKAMGDAEAQDYCKHVLHLLAGKLDEHVPHIVDESDEHLLEFMGGEHRYSYVIDTTGNVQLSDAMTGADLYLQGQDAQEFLGAIEQAGDDEDAKQQVMSQYEHVMDNQLDSEGNAIGLSR